MRGLLRLTRCRRACECLSPHHAEIHRLETVTEDDIEEMRRKRLESMKKVHQQRAEWSGAPRNLNESPVSVAFVRWLSPFSRRCLPRFRLCSEWAWSLR